jgi:hypothetical protein
MGYGAQHPLLENLDLLPGWFCTSHGDWIVVVWHFWDWFSAD